MNIPFITEKYFCHNVDCDKLELRNISSIDNFNLNIQKKFYEKKRIISQIIIDNDTILTSGYENDDFVKSINIENEKMLIYDNHPYNFGSKINYFLVDDKHVVIVCEGVITVFDKLTTKFLRYIFG
jgi:hypothetical protein